MVNLGDIPALARKYSVDELEIYLMGLNLNGVNDIDAVKSGINRERFRLSIPLKGEYFFAITVNENSPFMLSKGKLSHPGMHIGNVLETEGDTCDETYFRKGGKVITLNSNSRSNCRGCEFCGVYSLDTNDQNNLTTEERLSKKIESIKKEGGLESLALLEEVGIVTGCFKNEKETVNHLLMVQKTFQKHGFKGEVKYIGSQLREKDNLKRLSERGPFSLYLTVECFERRDQLIKPTKASLELTQGRKVLESARKIGIDTSILYILGLDSINSIHEEFIKYKPVLTRHPVINLMQNYIPRQETLRNSEAGDIEYYLKSRKVVEEIFGSTNLKPRIWENYRSPWLIKYAGKSIPGERI